MRNALRAISVTGILLSAVLNTIAARADDMIGKRIVSAKPGVKLFSDAAADSAAVPMIVDGSLFRVIAQRGEWLQSAEGWFRRADVLDVEEACAHFSREIEQSPTAFAFASRAYLSVWGDASPEEALKDAEAALRLDPKSSFAHFSRGECMYRKNAYQQALNDYSTALRLSPLLKAARIHRAHVYLDSVKVESTDVDAVLDTALDDLNYTIAHWPNDAFARILRSMVHRHSRRYEPDKSLEDLAVALRLWPHQHEKIGRLMSYSYVGRGRQAARAGKYAPAIADFTDAIRCDPKNGQAYRERGKVLLLVDRFEPAFDDLEHALRIEPRSGDTHRYLGIALINLDKPNAAIDHLDRSIELKPGVAMAYQTRALALRQIKKYRAAIEDLDKAISIDSRQVLFYQNRSAAWRDLGDLDRSLADCNRALELAPQDVDVLCERAALFILRNEDENALTDCTAAIMLAPRNDAAYHVRGAIYANAGEYRRAISDISHAISINPMREDYWINRARARLSNGQPQQALDDVQEALRISPQSEEARKVRSAIRKELETRDSPMTDRDDAIRRST